MTANFPPVLGIDLASDEVRVVELSVTEVGVEAECAGFRPIPEGSIVDGVVVQPTAIAGVLRKLLHDMGAKSRTAVFGLPPVSCMVRTLNLPPSTEDSLAELVDGEIQHFQILRTDGAAHGFFPLRPAQFTPGVDPAVALLMGAERPAIQGLTKLASLAGLKIARIEPTHLAMMRTAYDSVGTNGSVMTLLLSDDRSDISLVDEGNICFYRRIEVGLDDVWNDSESDAEQPTTTNDYPSFPIGNVATAAQMASPALIGRAVLQLSTELQRSMEYFARENRSSEPIERLVVIANRPGIEGVASQVGTNLGLEVAVVACPAPAADDSKMVLELMNPSAARYVAAFGLGLGELQAESPTPRLDLYTSERLAVAQSQVQRKVAWALASSIATLAIGIVSSYLVGMQANHVDHALGHVQDDIAAISSEQTSRDAHLQFQTDQTAALSAGDVGFSRVSDSIVTSVAAGVGLSEMRLYPTGTVDVAGESLDERALAETARRLQGQPMFEHVMLASFTKALPDAASPGVRFKLVCATRRQPLPQSIVPEKTP